MGAGGCGGCSIGGCNSIGCFAGGVDFGNAGCIACNARASWPRGGASLTELVELDGFVGFVGFAAAGGGAVAGLGCPKALKEGLGSGAVGFRRCGRVLGRCAMAASRTGLISTSTWVSVGSN